MSRRKKFKPPSCTMTSLPHLHSNPPSSRLDSQCTTARTRSNRPDFYDFDVICVHAVPLTVIQSFCFSTHTHSNTPVSAHILILLRGCDYICLSLLFARFLLECCSGCLAWTYFTDSFFFSLSHLNYSRGFQTRSDMVQ